MATQAPDPRLERFVKLLGGMENLPPKLPKPQTSATNPDRDHEAAFHNLLPSADQFLAENPHPDPSSGSTGKSHMPTTHMPARLTPTKPVDIPNPNNFKLDERMGEPTPPGMRFAVFLGIHKFPYKFVQKELLQPFATAFFDKGKFFNRAWDLYYIWSPYHQTAKATLFVPEYQLQSFIDEMNRAFSCANIKIDDYMIDEGLVMQFDSQDPELRPKLLGHSTSREQIEYFSVNITLPGYDSKEGGDYTTFQEKMGLAVDVGKNKKKGAKSKKSQETGTGLPIVQIQSKGQLSKAQRLLGLARKLEDASMPNLANLAISPLSPNKPAPFSCEKDTVIIAIDVEAWEKHHKTITEVGIATLDTRDLSNEPPGPNGSNWQKHIRARHVRIDENKHIVNHEFVQGCPDKFQFGTSEFVPLADIPRALAACFKEPFSKPALAEEHPTAATSPIEHTNPPPAPPLRNLVLLGHDISTDIAYLRQLGFDPLTRSNPTNDNVLDTASIYRAYSGDVNSKSLSKTLSEAFDMTAWWCHNAANDAVYTLWAFLGLAVAGAVVSAGGKDPSSSATGSEAKAPTIAVNSPAKQATAPPPKLWREEGDEGDEPLYLDTSDDRVVVANDDDAVFNDQEGWTTVKARLAEDGDSYVLDEGGDDDGGGNAGARVVGDREESEDREGGGVALDPSAESGVVSVAEGLRGLEDGEARKPKPVFGPERPGMLFTSGGAVLDV
ncbi:hypothetical protein MBLNU230_g0382t1 [Neophaeotheca triangularis]